MTAESTWKWWAIVPIILMSAGCGVAQTAQGPSSSPAMETVQLIQGFYGFQAKIPLSWTRRVWNTSVGSSLVEGTSKGMIVNSTWAVKQTVGVSTLTYGGKYTITKVFSPYFSVEITVPNSKANRTLAGHILSTIKLYHLPKNHV